MKREKETRKFKEIEINPFQAILISWPDKRTSTEHFSKAGFR